MKRNALILSFLSLAIVGVLIWASIASAAPPVEVQGCINALEALDGGVTSVTIGEARRECQDAFVFLIEAQRADSSSEIIVTKDEDHETLNSCIAVASEARFLAFEPGQVLIDDALDDLTEGSIEFVTLSKNLSPDLCLESEKCYDEGKVVCSTLGFDIQKSFVVSNQCFWECVSFPEGPTARPNIEFTVSTACK